MISPTLGLIISLGTTLGLLLLFSFERRRGARFFPRARAYADILVLETTRMLRSIFTYTGKDFVRHLIQYAYRHILRVILFLVHRFELVIERALYSHKTVEKRTVEGEEIRTKLDEVAHHKASVALSAAEKRAHKERSLQGY